jgi:nucleoside-diphosphate-sugar epimerase
MKRVLVTGATGFVGRMLCETLAREGYRVRAALRTDQALPGYVGEKALIGDIGGATDWTAALTDVEFIVHAAARAHVLADPQASAPLYFETNASGTQRLAQAAARAGVRRLIYVSSVKVNGERSETRAFGPQDAPAPEDAYGSSKWRGESLLAEVAARSDLGTAIVRPPLIYGPGVRANFLRLLSWVDKGWPLPFGAIHNRRSLVSVWNLCDLLVRLLTHPAACEGVWMVSDGEDLSTAGLIRRIAASMGKRVSLPAVPVGVLRAAAGLLGRAAEIERLCGSLFVDITHTRCALDWAPPVSVDEGLARTVAWYAAAGRHAGATSK